ncbi:MAG TPA: hypothetical protein VK797_14475 [Tepidisphaeraceae bacterium]|jgi:hypothetical protein|nr:hypothetical protein [Tepidisphaeraceae bacterium]
MEKRWRGAPRMPPSESLNCWPEKTQPNKTAMSDTAATPSNVSLTARADIQYRWRVWAFFIMVFGYGLWSARDGFIKWPQDNVRNQAIRDRGGIGDKDHNYAGILINRVLGVVLPAVSLPVFIWLMYRSRGAYQLGDGTLRVRGCEPVPIDRIVALDKSRFERKGVAIVEYQKADGSAASITLRDMVYERRTTDQIVEWIENYLRNGESVRGSPHPNPLPKREGEKATPAA